jgi:hypothetical protein
VTQRRDEKRALMIFRPGRLRSRWTFRVLGHVKSRTEPPIMNHNSSFPPPQAILSTSHSWAFSGFPTTRRLCYYRSLHPLCLKYGEQPSRSRPVSDYGVPTSRTPWLAHHKLGGNSLSGIRSSGGGASVEKRASGSSRTPLSPPMLASFYLDPIV